MTKLNFSNGNKKNVMPLLMNYTPSTKIEECNAFMQLTYDDLKQIIPLDMRIVGTKSLKTSFTRKKNSAGGVYTASDKKNEIDDQKNVK
ncbi:MAG: hypothetical protein PHO86_06130 [Bacilli bacterium]|nr:hypothetical protein [Bacteroidales bacterium]MDD3171880.1 hypothetical protein [Bacilli bacterium]